MTTYVSYSLLNEFIEEFISPCIVIFEDIDSFAESRQAVNNSQIADFLQFINGIGDRTDKIVFVATTNHLDKLDAAVANRPVRFNRKFEFKFPNAEDLKKLVELYFDADIAEKYYDLYSKKVGTFYGAHIKETQRTARLLARKRKMEIKDVFEDAFKLVEANFSPTLKKIGFNN